MVFHTSCRQDCFTQPAPEPPGPSSSIFCYSLTFTPAPAVQTSFRLFLALQRWPLFHFPWPCLATSKAHISWWYGLNVSVPTKFTCWNLLSNLMVVGGRAFRRWSGLEGGAFVDGISALIIAPLEKEMATHSSILAWRIPRAEKPGRRQSLGLQRVRHDWATNTHTHTHNSTPEGSLSPCRDTTRSYPSMSQKWISSVPKPAGTMMLDFPSFRTLRNNFLLFILAMCTSVKAACTKVPG